MSEVKQSYGTDSHIKELKEEIEELKIKLKVAVKRVEMAEKKT